MSLDTATYLAAVRSESADLLAAAEVAGIGAPVPTCPDWTVAGLLAHLGSAQRWQAALVGAGAAEPVAFPAAPDDPEAAMQWCRDGASELVAVLEAADPTATMWTLAGPGPARAWFRRAAHEVSLHRVDAQAAAGEVRPVDATLAADAIDEYLVDFVGGRMRERAVGAGETVHVHCTDVEGEWLVRMGPEGAEVERVHAKGDVAVRGGASDLLLALRGRGPDDTVEVLGDAAVLDLLRDRTRL